MTNSKPKMLSPYVRWSLPGLPVLAVLVLAYVVVSRGPTSKSHSLPPLIVVRAVGRDFQWHFRYPGPDATLETADDVVGSRTLYLPPDVDVKLDLTSDDYVYTMSLPKHGLKEIAVPDMTHTLRFHTETGAEIDLLVDPMCGFRFYHDEIMGRILVQERDDFFSRFGSDE